MSDKYDDRYVSYQEAAQALGGYERLLAAIRDRALRPGDALLVREEDFFSDHPPDPQRIRLTAQDYESEYERENDRIAKKREPYLDIYDYLVRPRFEKASLEKALKR